MKSETKRLLLDVGKIILFLGVAAGWIALKVYVFGDPIPTGGG
jgi:hypothetical protein